MLQAGERIADGQLPYRDFYANYGPGQYFLIGGLDWLFGPSLLTWRILRVLLDAGVAVLAYALVRRDAPEPLALGAWLAVAAAMAYPEHPAPQPDGAGARASAACCWPSAARRWPARWPAWRPCSGSTSGVAALAGVALLAGRRGAARAVRPARPSPCVLLAPVVIAAPGDFWDQTIGFALDEQGLQRLPLPGRLGRRLRAQQDPRALLPVRAAGGGRAVAGRWRSRGRLPARLWAAAPLAAAGVLYLLARADVFHLVPLAAVLPVLLATAAAASERRPRLGGGAGGRARPDRPPGARPQAHPAARPAAAGDDRRRRRRRREGADRRGARADRADAATCAPASRRASPVFVANPRFDLVRVGNPLVYVLVGRPNPTRYDVMQPGVVTTAPVQREIVARPRALAAARW